jgi:hypothetical protein
MRIIQDVKEELESIDMKLEELSEKGVTRSGPDAAELQSLTEDDLGLRNSNDHLYLPTAPCLFWAF